MRNLFLRHALSGVLTLVVVCLTVVTGRADEKHTAPKTTGHPQRTTGKQTVRLKLAGLHCGGCEMMVKSELVKVPGVQSATVSSKTQSATLTVGNKAPSSDALKKAVAKAGYRCVAVESGKTARK